MWQPMQLLRLQLCDVQLEILWVVLRCQVGHNRLGDLRSVVFVANSCCWSIKNLSGHRL